MHPGAQSRSLRAGLIAVAAALAITGCQVQDPMEGTPEQEPDPAGEAETNGEREED